MITGTEFRRLREEIGMTQQDVASFIGCGLRSVKYWEAGKSRIPERVFDRLEQIDAALKVYAARLLEAYTDQTEALSPESLPEVALIVYDDADADMVDWSLPFPTHSAAVFKAFRIFTENGITARIVKMDRDAYAAFLSGRPDTQAERSAWAALQTEKDKAP